MFEEIAFYITKIMEAIGVIVILCGAVFSSLIYLKQVFMQKDPCAYDILRKRLGRSILLGLEFLVAADIINTVGVKPTMESVLVLGVIVLIRTFLSFSIGVELEKRLPWQNKG